MPSAHIYRKMIVNDARLSAKQVYNKIKEEGNNTVCMLETTFKNKKTHDEFIGILVHRYQYKVADCTGHGMLIMVTNISLADFMMLSAKIGQGTNQETEVRVAPDLD